MERRHYRTNEFSAGTPEYYREWRRKRKLRLVAAASAAEAERNARVAERAVETRRRRQAVERKRSEPFLVPYPLRPAES